jgi:hypothetical protein
MPIGRRVSAFMRRSENKSGLPQITAGRIHARLPGARPHRKDRRRSPPAARTPIVTRTPPMRIIPRSGQDRFIIAIAGSISSVIRRGIGVSGVSGAATPATGARLIVRLHDHRRGCIAPIAIPAGSRGRRSSEAGGEHQQGRDTAEIEYTQGHGLSSITQAI